MRVTHFVLFVAIILMVVIGRPDQKQNPGQRQAEEEQVSKTNQEIILGDEILFPVRLEIQNQRDESLADILWLKKAASISLSEGSPYFNVVEQRVFKKFHREKNQRLTVIEGIIELDDDPMKAEYDSYEIEELVLTDFNN